MRSPTEVPAVRVAPQNTRALRRDGDYVLYWMIAARRTRSSFGLERAIGWARKLDKPLVVLEALRAGYPWASDRFHAFVIDGMRDQAAAFAAAGVRYVPYVEPAPGAGKGLLEALAQRACVVVTDEFPCFFLPRMVKSAATKLGVLLEAIDGNGLLPLRATETDFPTAYAFRRFLQKNLAQHLVAQPLAEPLEECVELPRDADLAAGIAKRWPAASATLLAGDARALAKLPIDHTVTVAAKKGGERAAQDAMRAFVRTTLPRYAEERSEPGSGASSGLSPWLHFGHVSPHDALAEIAKAEGWSPKQIATTTNGRKEGWWNLGASAEAFLDELVTWRELGYVFAFHRPDYDQFESLPEWAQKTLLEHADDPREHVYTLEQFAAARTHDPLWNAAQTQLVREGVIHNYLRMLWGKKIVEWTTHPREALAVMIELNNRYALDGRNPNSYSGIFWVLGRFDRPWSPKRKVFGTIRWMSSANTAKKLDVDGYLAKYSPGSKSLFD